LDDKNGFPAIEARYSVTMTNRKIHNSAERTELKTRIFERQRKKINVKNRPRSKIRGLTCQNWKLPAEGELFPVGG
jgi:hypothetical protein